MKNLCRKTVDIRYPYEIYANGNGWVWNVLKKYQAPDTEAKNEYARWFCFVTSPLCPQGEHGDVYVREILSKSHKVWERN